MSPNEHNAQIKSKLPTFGNPLSRFRKRKKPRQVESQTENSDREIYPRISEESDKLTNPDSSKCIAYTV
jgi:hypothetical protein